MTEVRPSAALPMVADISHLTPGPGPVHRTAVRVRALRKRGKNGEEERKRGRNGEEERKRGRNGEEERKRGRNGEGEEKRLGL